MSNIFRIINFVFHSLGVCLQGLWTLKYCPKYASFWLSSMIPLFWGLVYLTTQTYQYKFYSSFSSKVSKSIVERWAEIWKFLGKGRIACPLLSFSSSSWDHLFNLRFQCWTGSLATCVKSDLVFSQLSSYNFRGRTECDSTISWPR